MVADDKDCMLKPILHIVLKIAEYIPDGSRR